MEITKEAVRELHHGHVMAGVTRAKLTELGFTGYKGVLIRCPGVSDPGEGNDATVWVGGPGVTANSDTGTGGMPVNPGASLFVPLDQPNLIWVISTQASQDVAWMLI